MGRGRVGSGRRLVMVAGFVISAGAAVLLSSHTPPRSPGLRTRARAAHASCRRRSTSARPAPLPDPVGAARWAPVLRATVARRAPSLHSPSVGRISTRTPEGTTNIVEADRRRRRSRHDVGSRAPERASQWHPGLGPAQLTRWLVVRRHSSRDRPDTAHRHAAAGRASDLPRARRRSALRTPPRRPGTSTCEID